MVSQIENQLWNIAVSNGFNGLPAIRNCIESYLVDFGTMAAAERQRIAEKFQETAANHVELNPDWFDAVLTVIYGE